jgi:hypothetical protein
VPNVGDLTVRVGGDFSDLQKSSEKTLKQIADTIAEVTGAFGAITAATVKYTAVLSTSGQAAEGFANTYRAVRLALSPTPFTVATIAVGILTEETIKLTNARAKLIEQQSLIAATSGMGFNQIAAIGSVAGMSGSSAAAVQSLSKTSGLDASELGKVAAAWAAMEDPVKRAASAVRLFGENKAAEALRELTPEFAAAAEAADSYGTTLNEVSRNQIFTFRQDMLALKRAVTEMPPVFKVMAEEVKTRTEEMLAGAWAGLKAFLAGLDDAIAKATHLRGALVPTKTLSSEALQGAQRMPAGGVEQNTLIAERLYAESKAAADRQAATLEGRKTALEAIVKRSDEALKALNDDAARRQANPNATGLLTAQQRFDTSRSLDPTAAARLEAVKKEIKDLAEAEENAKKAREKETADLRKADEDDLNMLKENQQLTIQATINYWKARLKLEKDNADRVHEIQGTLANLYQERQREFDRLAERNVAATKKQAQEAEKVQSFLAEMAAEADANIQKITDDMAALQKRIDTARAVRTEQSSEHAVAMQRLAVEREYALLIAKTAQTEIAFAQQMISLDRQELDAKIRLLEAERAGETDPAKKLEIENQIAQVKNAAGEREFGIQTRIRQIQQENTVLGRIQIGLWSTFQHAFDRLAQGLASAITQARSFGQVMRGVLKSIEQEIIQVLIGAGLDKLRRMLEPIVAGWLHIKSATTGAAAAQIAANAAVTASATAAAVAQKALASALDMSLVAGAAAVAGAEAAASAAWGGPAAALAAGMAMYATVLGTFLPAATFEEGGLVPQTMVALVHKGEWVTPAAQVAQGAVGPRGAGSANVTIHVHEANNPRKTLSLLTQHLKLVGGPVMAR